MGSKSSQRMVWTRANVEPVNLYYTNDEFFLDPQRILNEAIDELPVVSVQGASDEPTSKQPETGPRPTSIKEMRRRFWHFRNRIKQSIRRENKASRKEKFTPSPKNQVQEGAPAEDKSAGDELFDPSLANLRVERDIRDLCSQLKTGSASERDKLQLLHRLYKAGLLSRASSLIDKHEALFYSSNDADTGLVDKIRAELTLLHTPPEIPELGDGPIVLPEGGRILYCAASTIHYHSNGYATRTSGLVGGLKDNGVDVVVAARPGYPWDVTTHRDYTKSIFHVKKSHGVEYAYSFGPSLKKQPLPQYIEYAVDSYLRLIEKYRPSHIHAASNHVTALPALIAARISGLPFTYEVRGFWEYALDDALGEPNERRMLATVLEDLVLSNSDHIFTLSPEMRGELEKRDYDGDSITVLPNGVDTNLFQPLPKVGDLVNKFDLNDGKTNIGYAGSMVAYEGLDVLTDALLELAEERNDFRLVLVGDGPVLPALERKIAEAEPPLEVKNLGRIAPKLMPNIISSFDLTVAARKSTDVTKLVSPLKPLESMAAGVPFVASDLPVLRGLVEESNGGVLFEAMNTGSLVSQIRKLLDEPERLQTLGRVGRSWAIEERQWKHLAAQLACEISNLKKPSAQVGRNLSEITIGIIADEFTTTSFQGAAPLVPLDRSNWERQLVENEIDLLFVESAWKGNNGQWSRGIGHYSEDESNDLEELVVYCNANRIPTVFWNKEDPIHFDRFKRNAMHFDLVLTTDNRSVARYQRLQERHNQKFGSLPFFATPRVHHPVVEKSTGDSQVVYAGSYYGDRYPERSERLLDLLEAAKKFKLSIFDRQVDNPESPYKFPADLESYVRGGLSYQEMLEAYRQVPIHLNVNSVSRSETMFSRRVVEIGSTGGMVLSSPSVAMSMLFSGFVPQAQSSTGAQELLALATASPELRNLHGWNLRRLVRRSHSVYTRLVTVMRRLGINVKGLSEPRVGVVIQSVPSDADLQTLAEQTIPPCCVSLPDDWPSSSDFRCTILPEQVRSVSTTDIVHQDLDYVFYWNGERLDAEMLEDAIFLAEDVSASEVYIDRARPETIFTPLSLFGAPSSEATSFIRYVGSDSRSSRLLTMNRGAVGAHTSEGDDDGLSGDHNDSRLHLFADQLRDKNIVVAGHDLKFISPIISKLDALGINVNIDQWDSHNSHDEERSLHLLEEADVVFCEWGLGNAVWYSQHVRANQRLIVRTHSQELFRPYLQRLNSHNVDEMIFVAPHIRDAARNISNLRQINSRIIPNFVRARSRTVLGKQDNRFTIGMVGVVPQQKGLDKALDLLELLRETDQRFTLRIKGKVPEDYSWMLDRHDEMAFYKEQYERIATSPLLRDAVHFDGYSSDWAEMASWYESIGIVISVSEFESFHFTLVDGPLHGALPISLRWPGADRLYPEAWLANDISEMSEMLLTSVPDALEWKNSADAARYFVEKEYDGGESLVQILESMTQP